MGYVRGTSGRVMLAKSRSPHFAISAQFTRSETKGMKFGTQFYVNSKLLLDQRSAFKKLFSHAAILILPDSMSLSTSARATGNGTTVLIQPLY